ncbi:MAG TPA: response regulator transcription factor [Polyangia bacterium]|nr:response regulator transcription factor [Polyangia bacterium]
MSQRPFPPILLVDDHAVVRRGLRELLGEEFPSAEFGEAASGAEALAQIAKRPWGLVILDVSLPGRDGLEILKEALALRPGVPIMMLSVHAEDQYAIRALRAGAAGYVTKETAAEDLTAAVRKILQGGKYVSPRLAEQMVAALATRDGTTQLLHEGLSDRELQVLRMLAVGKSVKEIGLELALSEKTISTYRTRIIGKMKMRSNAELMRYALRAGLVD